MINHTQENEITEFWKNSKTPTGCDRIIQLESSLKEAVHLGSHGFMLYAELQRAKALLVQVESTLGQRLSKDDYDKYYNNKDSLHFKVKDLLEESK